MRIGSMKDQLESLLEERENKCSELGGEMNLCIHWIKAKLLNYNFSLPLYLMPIPNLHFKFY